MTNETYHSVSRLLAEGLTHQQIAEQVGCSKGVVERVRQRRVRKVTASTTAPRKKGGGYMPSPEDIEAACREIRETRISEPDFWLPPTVAVSTAVEW